jgi:hypothetical protein
MPKWREAKRLFMLSNLVEYEVRRFSAVSGRVLGGPHLLCVGVGSAVVHDRRGGKVCEWGGT